VLGEGVDVNMSYTAVYEREPDGRWTVSISEVKGCHSYGRTIDQARERVREALGLFVEDADAAKIVDDVRLPTEVKKQVKSARELRQKVVAQEFSMVLAQWKAVRALRAQKLGHRDAGRLLGLSHQRVLQLEQRSMPKMPGAVIEQASSARDHGKKSSKKR
jgi:predicted RNase H-like HicB family nuclease